MTLRCLLLTLVAGAACLVPRPAAAQNPYAAEGAALAQGRSQSLRAIRDARDTLAPRARTAVELCTVAELSKLIGDPAARTYYERAILADPEEPAYELLYGDYLRVYRGAGQRPLFPEAATHLHAARLKLARRATDRTKRRDWDEDTATRVRRSLNALYERDGFPLAGRVTDVESRGESPEASSEALSQPWLFLGLGARAAQSTSDFDRSSDNRDLTSAALFSASRARLGRSLTDEELAALVRNVTPLETSANLRLRLGAAPVLDVFAARRSASNAQITNFFQPGGFNDLTVTDFGVSLEKPFTIGGATDALIGARADRIGREGLIEFLPQGTERINQFAVSGALSHSIGPDKIGVSYTFVRQLIDPDERDLPRRDRTLMGGTVTYQLFRPLPGRDVTSGRGRRFEPRGIDLFAGMLHDRERFPTNSNDVFITRRDVLAGVAVRGLGRFDLTIQPTWYSSRVTDDDSQHNAQLRLGGTIVARILDEERTAGMPSQRIAGWPIAFVQVVVPYHWDTPLDGPGEFRSRRAGVELWTKFFTDDPIGVTTLLVVAYARQSFPDVGKGMNLLSARVTVGF